MPLPFARTAPAVARPTFSRDFAGLKTLDHGVGPAITFTRGSDATYFNAAGTLTTATTNEPRFDHSATGSSLGLLIEEARTNSIRNSQAGGAAAGVSGTMPTNWAASANPHALTREIVGTGTANGLSYVDIRYSGTANSTNGTGIFFEAVNQVTAASGQTWTTSTYVALVGGSASGINAFRIIVQETNGTTNVQQSTSSIGGSLTSSLQRFSVTRAFTDATTTHARPAIDFSYTSGAVIDFTLRIAAPQLEQGAFPTSYIPTTTAAATRAADSAVVTPISSFYNQSEGTLFAEYSPASLPPSGNFPRALSLGNATNNDNRNVLAYFNSSGSLAHLASYFVANVQQLDKSSALGSVGQTFKAASAVATNSGHYALNGLLVGAEDTSITMGQASDFTHLFIARQSSGPVATTAVYIRKIAYWPKRLTNTLLQQLTT